MTETIPFVQTVGITHKDSDHLILSDSPRLQNHLGTLHAGALYTLAETQSALCLMQLFPDLQEKVIPLLRSGGLKYKHPVTESVTATADVLQEEQERFMKRFLHKGRATVTVTVTLKTEEEEICAEGDFVWFVQRKKF